MEYEALESERQMVLSRIDADATSGTPPLCMSSAALTEADLKVWQHLWESKEFCSAKNIKPLRSEVDVAPLPRLAPRLPACEEAWSTPKIEQPSWVSPMARYREFFLGSALVAPLDDGSVAYYKIIYIVQNPLYMALAPLEREETVIATAPAGATAQEINQNFRLFDFSCNFANCMSAADLPEVELSKLSFIQNLRHDGDTVVTSAWEPESVESYLTGSLPHDSRDATGRPAKKKEIAELDKLVEEMPWLDHLDKMQDFARKLRAELESEPKAKKAAEDIVNEIDEEAILSAVAMVEAERASELAISAAMGLLDFRTSHLAGDSTMRESGVYYDACQGRAVTKSAEKWARDTPGLQITFKATFTAHTEALSKVICRCWCHRMQHFFNLQQSHTGGDFEFTQAMKDAYPEPKELRDLERDTKSADTLALVRAIRRIPF